MGTQWVDVTQDTQRGGCTQHKRMQWGRMLGNRMHTGGIATRGRRGAHTGVGHRVRRAGGGGQCPWAHGVERYTGTEEERKGCRSLK